MRLITTVLFLIPLLVFAQDPIENSSFESWIYDDGGDYYEPDGYWGTLNPLSKLFPGAPVTTFREEEDVYAGDYAVRLVTGDLFGTPVGGTMVTGYFDPDEPIPTEALKLGQPFTGKPQRFTGYYKFFPEEWDSCAMAVQLTHWDGENQILVGEAGIFVNEIVDSYTMFDIEFSYFSELEPDSILVALTASAEAANFMAVAGTTLYVDEIGLVYDDGTFAPFFPDNEIQIYPNPSADFISLKETQTELQFPIEIEIYNIEGKRYAKHTIFSATEKIDIQSLTDGQYIIKLANKRISFHVKK